MTFQAYLPLDAELELELVFRMDRCTIDEKAHEPEREKSKVS
jgi:hypothetical protein